MNAFFLTKAVALLEEGRLKEADRYLIKARYNDGKRALVAAMRSYICLLQRNSESARSLAEDAHRLASTTTDGRYVRRYADFILAILDENGTGYKEAWHDLKVWPCSKLIKEALPLNELATPNEVKTAGL